MEEEEGVRWERSRIVEATTSTGSQDGVYIELLASEKYEGSELTYLIQSR